MISERGTVFFVGTAGAGKSHLVAAYDLWCKQHALTTVTVNLDPGAEGLPYAPDIDVRERIQLSDVMAEYDLGPNGAQIVAADLIATQIDEIREELLEVRADVVLVDTPGQLELFVFRHSGKFIMDHLDPEKSVLCYCIDPFLTRTPGSFASQLLLAATTWMRFDVPLFTALTKSDLVDADTIHQFQHWASDLQLLEEAIHAHEETTNMDLATRTTELLAGLGIGANLVPTSTEDLEGLEDLYRLVQTTVGESEDVTPEYDTFLPYGEEDVLHTEDHVRSEEPDED